MNVSKSAYMVAGHFGARYLESWHLLIAMSNHSYSVAGATLNDYPYEMDRLEEVALELTETDYSQDETFTELPFSHRLQVLFDEAEYVASVVHAKVLGTEHVLYAICMMVMPWRLVSWRGLVFLMKTRKIRSRLLLFVEI